MNNYRVGQILFLIANNTVVPVQVIEEVVRTTLEGKEKTHIVKFPDKNGTEADIASIKGKIFTTKDKAYNYMITNATNAIKNMVEEADKVAEQIFNIVKDIPLIESKVKDENETSENMTEHLKVQPEANNNIIKIDLGGGQFGRIAEKDLEKIKGAKWKYYY